MNEAEKQLWIDYRSDRSDEHRNQIFELWWPWIESNALASIRSRRLERFADEILSQVSLQILTQAIPDFQPSVGSFPSYLRKQMQWAIQDACRLLDGVSNRRRIHRKLISTAREQLSQDLGHRATDHEVAEATGTDEEDVIAAKSKTCTQDMQLLPDADPTEDDIDRLLQGLKPRSQQVLKLYFHGGLKLHEIGAILGIQEARASQIVADSLKFLKEKL